MKWKIIRVHILIWMLFIGWETVLIGFLINSFNSPFSYITHYSIIIIIFYVLGDVVLPFIQKYKYKLLTIPLFATLFFVIYVLSHYLGDLLLVKTGVLNEETWGGLNKEAIYRNLYRAVYFLGFSVGYFYLKNYFSQRNKAEELEKAKLLAEIEKNQSEKQLAIMQNAYLKAQINPHFLFNTLDFVYHHTKKHSPIAAEALIKLSQMMRFAIDSDQMSETVILGDELEQVENLIYLHELRKNDRKMINFYFDMAVVNLRFLPLIVLTLVENIFKHGDLLTKPAEISITMEDDILKIYVWNMINKYRNVISNNKGVTNIAERLQFTYGDQQTFNFRITEEEAYETILTVSLDALR